MSFSTHLTLESSATVTINSLALAKKARGERVYNLSAGEPILPPHPSIIKAAEEALRAGKTLYPPAPGISELRQLAAAWMSNTYAAAYSPENTLITCGGKFGVYVVCQAYLEAGDGALIVAPYWVSYPSIVRIFKGVPQIVTTTESRGWKARVEDIETQITAHTKVLILNNGANPTGTVYSRAELESFLQLARTHNLLVIADEVYSGLTYDGEFVSLGSFPEYQDRVIVIQSFSKHFAMTGWRVGMVFAAPEIITVLSAVQSQSTTGTASISQWAAVGALRDSATVNEYVKNAMSERRKIMIDELKNNFGVQASVPAGLYAFVSLPELGSAETSSVRFCERLLQEANVAVVPGSAFGAEGYVRLSFGAPGSELREAVIVLRQFLKSGLVSR